VLIALGLVRHGGLGAHALAFLLFRVLDVAKPGFLHDVQRAPGGLGIMLDDVFAGLGAGLVARLVAR
jgi:phosphatidylglycerophosphatase A